MRPFKAWIALSSKGYPAYFIGIFTTKKSLKQHYSITYGAGLEAAGYKAEHVDVRPTSTTAKDK